MQETTEDGEDGSFARNADQFMFSLQSLSSVCLQGRAAGIKPSVDLASWPLAPQKGKESVSPIKIRLLVVIK